MKYVENDKVQHEGEFVLTCEGKKDFGEITPEIAHVIRRQAGKIRLRVGIQEINSERGFGERHIERPNRMKELKLIGFDNARDFITYIASDFDAIYKGAKGSIIIYKKGNHHTEIVSRLEHLKDADFWDVKTAYITRKDSKKNKSRSGKNPKRLKSESVRAQSKQRKAFPKRYFSGNPA